MIPHPPIACARCPRLAAYRGNMQTAPRCPERHQEAYWGKPVPGFGDPEARLLILGLAPAFHGGNRTGRVFTGDSSGGELIRSLYEMGYANQPTSTRRDDGLELRDVYITNAVRCAPPGNRPTLEEITACLPHLWDELGQLHRVTHILALGAIAHTAVLRLMQQHGAAITLASAPFAHGRVHALPGGRYRLVDCYHPSRQNLATGLVRPGYLKALFRTLGWWLPADHGR